jgi:AcrR family transcriptional regulator
MPPPAQAAQLRRARHRDDARRTILSATEALMAESGYAGFSMRALVERCGYSAPTIYHYFTDKPGLLEAVVEEKLEDLVKELEALPVESDPVAQARTLSLVFARWGIGNPTHYHLINQPRDRDPSPGSAAQRAVDLMSKPLDSLLQRGQITESELALISQSLWACLHGLISLPSVRPDADWSPDLLEASVDALFRGWLDEFASQTPKGSS